MAVIKKARKRIEKLRQKTGLKIHHTYTRLVERMEDGHRVDVQERIQVKVFRHQDGYCSENPKGMIPWSRYPIQYRLQVLEAYSNPNRRRSIPECCRQDWGIALSTFYEWKKRFMSQLSRIRSLFAPAEIEGLTLNELVRKLLNASEVYSRILYDKEHELLMYGPI